MNVAKAFTLAHANARIAGVNVGGGVCAGPRYFTERPLFGRPRGRFNSTPRDWTIDRSALDANTRVYIYNQNNDISRLVIASRRVASRLFVAPPERAIQIYPFKWRDLTFLRASCETLPTRDSHSQYVRAVLA